VVLAGISVPLYGAVGVVLFASSIYAFSKAESLKYTTHSMELCRRRLINLGTDNPTLDNPNPTEE